MLRETLLPYRHKLHMPLVIHAQGFTSLSEKVNVGSTVWSSTHLPQNREVMLVSSGDGTLYLYKYHYPDQRKIKVNDLAFCVCEVYRR
jgi:hypothetical protein